MAKKVKSYKELTELLGAHPDEIIAQALGEVEQPKRRRRSRAAPSNEEHAKQPAMEELMPDWGMFA